MIKGMAKAVLLVMAVCMLTTFIYLTIKFIDEVSEPMYGDQMQKMQQQLPPFVISDYDNQAIGPSLRSPIIGIYRKDENGKMQFHCTAFVVSNRYAITASHCLVDESWRIVRDKNYIHDVTLKNTGIIAKAASINTRADLGAMIGDFSSFHKLKMETTYGMLKLSGPFFTCGFPWGATPPVCNGFRPQAPYYDKIKGLGFMTPGMSGGPVIDSATGMVGAVNVEVHDGDIAVAPVIGIFGALEIPVK